VSPHSACERGVILEYGQHRRTSGVCELSESTNTEVKAFLSYSWTSDAHEQWVLDLASRLTQDGVRVLFDKWDLQIGHDPNAFMEQMVTDPEVTKVLMVCDRVYTDKANGREGGVGKEAQILTPEIYRKAAQDKYAALITERNEAGDAYVPAYYGGRQYIDFTEVGRQEERYVELLRWIYDKPKHVRPQKGKIPEFIVNPTAVAPGTTSAFKRADAAIRAGQPGAVGHLRDFGDALIAEFQTLRPVRDNNEPWDEQVWRTAAELRPSLHHFSEIMLAEARFGGSGMPGILSIFERMGAFMYRPANVNSWNESDFDPYRMMCYEGFLSLVAVLISEQRFDLLRIALTHPYLIDGHNDGGRRATTTYRIFNQNIECIANRTARLNLNRVDLYSDLIMDTYKFGFPNFSQLLQADLVLHVRENLSTDRTDWHQWWPRLLIYGERSSTELFARSESQEFFNKWAPAVFGKISPVEFREKMAKVDESDRSTFRFRRSNIQLMTNSANIGCRP
jgi:hypothetical protein